MSSSRKHDTPPSCCNRPMNRHGTSANRQRYRCPLCHTVIIDGPLLRLPTAYGHVYADARGREIIHLSVGHPFANTGGWQYLARYRVMYELNKVLRCDEHVHHVDLDISNNSIENLELVTATYHGCLHASAVALAGYRDALGKFDKTVVSICTILQCTKKQAITLLTTLPQSDRTIINWCACAFITPSVFDHIDTLVKLTDDEWSIICWVASLSTSTTIECAADDLLQCRTS